MYEERNDFRRGQFCCTHRLQREVEAAHRLTKWKRERFLVLLHENCPLIFDTVADVLQHEYQESSDGKRFVGGLGEGEVGVGSKVAIAEKADNGVYGSEQEYSNDLSLLQWAIVVACMAEDGDEGQHHSHHGCRPADDPSDVMRISAQRHSERGADQ